ncbi:DUF1826 domain-containing protein [Candidatus Pelagadaptatus aseana]|uniref:DUF1826 domain-containing protein n=1 Tax=Candidatus Pelagadaptatus aseana TaxID=3120508 RepID=UPI003C7034F4
MGQPATYENGSAATTAEQPPYPPQDPMALTDIYQADTNIAIWERNLEPQLMAEVENFLACNSRFQLSTVISPDSAYQAIYKALGNRDEYRLLSEDIAQLVDMFCCLFELERVGLRLTVLDRAMCPRFHVDRVPCRLVTTYQGIATEWLPHQAVDRSKLGMGNGGKPDEISGLIKQPDSIKRLNAGDIGLLKGELWIDNEGAGLVHRSPAVTEGERRLLLTLDFN